MVVALGSVLGTAADVVDELRDEGVPVGTLGITCFRPWPFDEVREALAHASQVVVVNRAVSSGRAASSARTSACRSPESRPWCTTSSLGLGGRPVTRHVLRRLVEDVRAGRISDHALTFPDLDAATVSRELARSSTAPRHVLDGAARAGDHQPRRQGHDRPQALPGRDVRGRQPPARTRTSAPSSRAVSAATPSPRATAPAAAAARHSAPGSSSTPRCAPPAAGWSPSTRPAASRSSPRRTPSRPGACRGCTPCSATPRRSRPAWRRRCAPRAATTSASSPRPATAAPSTSAWAACPGCSSATTTCCSSATTTRAT